MLLIGIAPLPYGYYELLRLVATGVFGWAAYVSWKAGQTSLPWALGLLALIFNPLIPIHLSRPVWMIIDSGAAIFVLLNVRTLRSAESS